MPDKLSSGDLEATFPVPRRQRRAWVRQQTPTPCAPALGVCFCGEVASSKMTFRDRRHMTNRRFRNVLMKRATFRVSQHMLLKTIHATIIVLLTTGVVSAQMPTPGLHFKDEKTSRTKEQKEYD